MIIRPSTRPAAPRVCSWLELLSMCMLYRLWKSWLSQRDISSTHPLPFTSCHQHKVGFCLHCWDVWKCHQLRHPMVPASGNVRLWFFFISQDIEKKEELSLLKLQERFALMFEWDHKMEGITQTFTASDWSQQLHGLSSEITESNYLNKSWISILWSRNASCKALHWQGSSVRLYNWHLHKLLIFGRVVLERSEVLSYPWTYQWNSERAYCWMPHDHKKPRAHCLSTNKKRASGKSISFLLKKIKKERISDSQECSHQNNLGPLGH